MSALFLTESSKSPASIAQSNKQWVGTCLHQEWCKSLQIIPDQIGQTVYIVCYHFDEDTKETMQEKINRMLVTKASRQEI